MSNGLLVGPFPKFVSREEKEAFLIHFGATKVNHISKKNKEMYVVGIFCSHLDCEYALKKIHQVEIFGRRLIAKYSEIPQQHIRKEPHEKPPEDVEPVESTSKLKNNLQNYEAQLAAISSNFDIRHPISPKLKYLYPPPSPKVIANIAHTLVAVPKFYTQVLHLMNKMNLPCPFGPLTAEPPLLLTEAKSLTRIFNTQVVEVNSSNHTDVSDLNDKEVEGTEPHESYSEAESELESDEESKTANTKEKIIHKRIVRRKNAINKKPRLETLKQSLNTSRRERKNAEHKESISTKEVFDMTDLCSHKKMQVNLQHATLPVGKSPSDNSYSTEGFGKLYPPAKLEEEGEEEDKPSRASEQFISLNELTSNRIAQSEWPLIPVFKKYDPGTPSPRLYIKNLSKTTNEGDLKYIFGRYVLWANEEESLKFNIRLYKEGRMKGQAFVTFSSVETASIALSEVNGYILKDKPLVIVFGKVKPS